MKSNCLTEIRTSSVCDGMNNWEKECNGMDRFVGNLTETDELHYCLFETKGLTLFTVTGVSKCFCLSDNHIHMALGGQVPFLHQIEL